MNKDTKDVKASHRRQIGMAFSSQVSTISMQTRGIRRITDVAAMTGLIKPDARSSDAARRRVSLMRTSTRRVSISMTKADTFIQSRLVSPLINRKGREFRAISPR